MEDSISKKYEKLTAPANLIHQVAAYSLIYFFFVDVTKHYM